ncbi:unnamed protein product [Phytophthora fragariaefolia]|uniref:Unnamed protein product n=1 Tax=Phytophthora fragariaefolia TaxID=1490495 RepID=A0A9W6U064_9STRA|nr:unnamed protein product [Phytophthora fragariaefolia]
MTGSGSTPSTPTVTSSGQGASTAAAATPVMTTATSSVASGAVAGLAGTGTVPGPGASAGGLLGAVSGYGLPRAGMAGGSGTPAVPTFYGGGHGIGGFNFGSISTGLAGIAGYGSPRVGMATAPVKMDNVPKIKGSFDLFAVQLHAEMICQEETDFAMWNRFVDKQTKREYSNYIFARAEFYSNVYSSDKGMDSWLREMESLRRQFLHYGKRVSDEDYAETLLGHVARTHRDVVRQFSKDYVVRRDGGADRPVPTATQVMNALGAESALDEKIGVEEQKPAGVAACGRKAAQQKQQRENQGKRKRKRGGGGGKKEGKQDSKRKGKKNGKGDTRTCFNCGEVGHLRVNCPYRDSSDEEKDNTGFATSDRKRWQNKSDGDKSKKKKMEAVGCISREALTVSSVSDSRGGTVEWALDSASDVHVCNRQELLTQLQNDKKHVFLGYDGAVSVDEKVGNVQLTIRNNKQPHQDVSLRLDSVLYKPSAPDNLLSLDLLEKAGWHFKTGFTDSQRVAWLSKGRLQVRLLKSRGRYRMQTAVRAVYHVTSMHQRSQLVDGDARAECTGAGPDSLVRRHLRFAHLNLHTLKQMAHQQVVTGMSEKLNNDDDTPCWSCRELLNNKLVTFLTTRGIKYTWTNGYSPEENGLAERMNGIVAAQVRCILTTANMPDLLWGEAFGFAVEVRNISATKPLNGETPYFRRFRERPDVSKLRTWGCVVFVFTPKKLRKNKLENPGKPGIFMGFAKHSESFRVLSLLTGNVQEVRSVEFHEEWTVDRNYVDLLLANRYGKARARDLPAVIPFVRLPVTGKKTAVSSEEHPLKRHRCDGDSAATLHTEVETPVCAGAPVVVPLRCPEVTPPTAVGDRSLVRGVNPPRVRRAEAEVGQEMRGLQGVPNSHLERAQQPEMSRGTSPSVGERVVGGEVDEGDPADAAREEDDLEEKMAVPIASGDHQIPIDEVANALSDNGSDEDEEEERDTTESFRRSTRVRHSNPKYADFEVDLPASLGIEAVNALMEPQTVQEALNAPDADKWIEALEKEWKDLMRNNTWELVERPKGKTVLSSKWVFIRKRDANGNVARHRARITIKGCQQKYGVDFWETYSPVVAQEAVKFILLLALHLGLNARHVDFVTAFLNGPIDDDVEIYMEMPEYFDDGSGRVCRLLRSLYSLKQTPMIWYRTLDKYLRQCGFRRTKMDGGVYTRSVGSSPIFVAVYVDDLVIVGTGENIELVLNELRAKFQIKDLGPVTDLLHMQISYVPGEALWISQRGYIDKVLRRFGMGGCRPVTTPQAVGDLHGPGGEDEPGVNDPSIPYRELVGCLQYLVQGTRPEIANAVRTLGKYMSKYTKDHYVMAKRVLRYLQGTRDYGLLWMKPASPDMHITAYADAGLGSEKDDRRSITGFVLQINGCTYAYKSHKQSITHDDTCSTEFIAAAECSMMIVWTHNLCEELNLRRNRQTVLFQDNQSTIKVIMATKGNYKIKGADLKYRKVRDLYERGDFTVQYCPTTDMLADIFMKPLGSTQFYKLRERLNVVPLPLTDSSTK